MNEIIVIIICLIISVIIKIGLNIKFKNLKQFKNRTNENLSKLSEKFSKDEIMCKDILKMLNNNSNVKIVYNEEYNTCLYTVYNNTITIGKFKESYMKAQTIAHECIHACQSKVILWFNFIISNIYNLFWITILILTLLNKLPYTNVFMMILIALAFIQYVIRNTLETDAMTKAPYIAKKYLEESNKFKKEEINMFLEEYEEVNKIGIPISNYFLILKNLIRIIIFCIAIII